MKQTTLLKPLAGLVLNLVKLVEPWAAKLAQPAQAPNQTSEQELREAPLLVEAEESSGPADYRHWGLNE